MNHLAHVVLAGPDPDDRLGAFLGDHIKGIAAVNALSPGVARGVRLHRRIDVWSDNHPAVVGLRAETGPYWRRYSGVIIDVLFDAMLVRHWNDYQSVPLETFGREIDHLLAARKSELPPRLLRFSVWARRAGLWTRYDEREMLDAIFARLADRHGRAGPLADGTKLLDRLEPDIERAFFALFPWLQQRAADFLDKFPENA
ncbi:MAG TPA: ACP phosphodiesterase [Wenzhouxiangellaceae bacterium]|nr:ACP phosphodiesterase [Wenzhouxiangellaceae bacterium]